MPARSITWRASPALFAIAPKRARVSTLLLLLLDALVDALLDLIDREARGGLTRRIVHEGLEEAGSVERHPTHQIGVLYAPIVVLVRYDVGPLIGSMRRLYSLGMRRQVNGEYQTAKPPGFSISQNTAFQFPLRNATSTASSLK